MLRVLLILVILSCAWSASVWGASSVAISLSATVIDSCRFSSGGVVPLGVLDRSIGGDVAASSPSAARFVCTAATPFAITDNGGNSGSYFLRNPSGATIPYQMSYTAAGSGTGTVTDLAMTSIIAGADYQSAPEGEYRDTLVLTISY